MFLKYHFHLTIELVQSSETSTLIYWSIPIPESLNMDKLTYILIYGEVSNLVLDEYSFSSRLVSSRVCETCHFNAHEISIS